MKKKVKQRKPRKKRKINKKRILIFFLVLFFIALITFIFMQLPTRNIFVYDNKILSDQIIIDQAKLTNYPNLYTFSLRRTASKLMENEYILKARLERQRFSEIHIWVEENYPLYIVDYQDETVLYDGQKVSEKFNVPVLINYVPDVIYERFFENMRAIDETILMRISEIKYNPDDLDDERFLFYMVDGNYVSVNIDTMIEINEYVFIMEKIISEFGNKKGVLYLDRGGYFDPFP